MKIDARRLVRDFGGHADLMRKFAAAGTPVSTSEKFGRDTIEKWCARNSIPGKWLVTMNNLQKFDVATYVLKPTKKKAKK